MSVSPAAVGVEKSCKTQRKKKSMARKGGRQSSLQVRKNVIQYFYKILYKRGFAEVTKMLEKKSITKSAIIGYMMQEEKTSKVELAKKLNLSMPTVLSNVNELMELGLIEEVGEYESTGGRKAKSISIRKEFRYAIGLNVTANHIGIVLLNFKGEIEKWERKRIKFRTDVDYFQLVAAQVRQFIEDTQKKERILGIGISLPGIINEQNKMLSKSHVLQLENYSLHIWEQVMPFPVYFANDANAAMMAENLNQSANEIYLSLNNTVGGAISINGNLFSGQNFKAGEFGHMILMPGGKQCYCGKKGCADAYCSARVLTELTDGNLEAFAEKLKSGDEKAVEIWEQYLEKLAVLISNLRMAYDTDIILGGDVGGILHDYMLILGEKLFRYNLFDKDSSYLKNCRYQKEASAVGVAKYFFDEFIKNTI